MWKVSESGDDSILCPVFPRQRYGNPISCFCGNLKETAFFSTYRITGNLQHLLYMEQENVFMLNTKRCKIESLLASKLAINVLIN